MGFSYNSNMIYQTLLTHQAYHSILSTFRFEAVENPTSFFGTMSGCQFSVTLDGTELLEVPSLGWSYSSSCLDQMGGLSRSMLRRGESTDDLDALGSPISPHTSFAPSPHPGRSMPVPIKAASSPKGFGSFGDPTSPTPLPSPDSK